MSKMASPSFLAANNHERGSQLQLRSHRRMGRAAAAHHPFIFVDFLAVEVNGSDIKPGICVTVNTRSYRHTENIPLDFEPNRYYLMKINRNS